MKKLTLVLRAVKENNEQTNEKEKHAYVHIYKNSATESKTLLNIPLAQLSPPNRQDTCGPTRHAKSNIHRQTGNTRV